MDNKISSDLLRGHTDTMILKILLESDCYGYQIIKLINKRSNNEYNLKEATMYSSVRRLEADGEITCYWGDESSGGRRKYFKITNKGIKSYEENKKKWQDAKRIIENLI